MFFLIGTLNQSRLILHKSEEPQFGADPAFTGSRTICIDLLGLSEKKVEKQNYYYYYLNDDMLFNNISQNIHVFKST